MSNFLKSMSALGASAEDVSRETKIRDLQFQTQIQEQSDSFNRGYIEELKDEVEELQHEVERYKALLSKPMQEIARQHGGFKRAYEAQQKLLADWIVSQKAYKEVAMQFADKLGVSRDEVNKQGSAAEEVILTDQSKFGNNIISGDFVDTFKGELLADLQSKKTG
ncbi:hypothetical protein ABEG10_11750 [Burkholderia cenocepacia]|uniref:hypothetical protein n=1 Tax=Burkholderia cenocepacia TaxID=95486 RepID=UPI0020A0A60E|nr:hypothetical protein [Burkholderia cenocepacia]MCO8321135.1 hypothetical protein [Burkholderia cenocepacia]MCO8328605.1 hypothetical protein [Burkholderia cenocepacia]MCO8335891.1 hypothetical protein [Burkholderia cenocepacia]MCO8342990.1 hypothetical protein [Burkholderia cenocepacia]MCO8356272.1 hypothetical protein [Burkholderia cenocepacia]